MNSRQDTQKPSNNKAQPVKSKNEPLFSKSITKDLNTTSPTEDLPTTLYGLMKSLPTKTIGENSLVRRIFGVYRQQSLPVLNKVQSIEIKEIPVPEPKSNEALIKIHCIGIRGSNLHYYEHEKSGDVLLKSQSYWDMKFQELWLN